MRDIKNYQRKKRIALIELAAFSVFFVGLLLYMGKHMGGTGVLLLVYAVAMIIWVSLLISYEILSAKIEILKELQNKENLEGDTEES